MSEPEIVVVGSLNADLIVRVPRFPAPGETISGDGFAIVAGGKGANQAAAAGRLGGRVAMIGQVGADANGTLLRDALNAAGVDTRLVAVDEAAATGVAVITIDAHGENEIVLAAGANGTYAPERLAPALVALRAARVVLLQLEIPLATVMRAAAEARSAGAVVVLDPAPAVPIPDQLLALADYVTPNERELAMLAGGTPTADDTPHRGRGRDGSSGPGARRGARAGEARRPRCSARDARCGPELAGTAGARRRYDGGGRRLQWRPRRRADREREPRSGGTIRDDRRVDLGHPRRRATVSADAR